MSPGWADVQRALITAAQACALAVQELAGRPDDGAAVFMAELTRGCLESLAGMARRWVLDEAVLEAERARAYAEGYAACKAERCRMRVIDGGRAGPH